MKSSSKLFTVLVILLAVAAGAQTTGKAQFIPVGEDPPAAAPAKGDGATDAKADATAAAEPKKDDAGGETVNSAVNVIRRTDRTEVMMRNGEVYYLPSGSKNAAIFAACEESEKTGKAVSLVVNPRSRVIQSVGGSANGTAKANTR